MGAIKQLMEAYDVLYMIVVRTAELAGIILICVFILRSQAEHAGVRGRRAKRSASGQKKQSVGSDKE